MFRALQWGLYASLMQKEAGKLGFLGFVFFSLSLSLFHYHFAFSSPFWFDPPCSDLYLFLPTASNSILENVARFSPDTCSQGPRVDLSSKPPLIREICHMLL